MERLRDSGVRGFCGRPAALSEALAWIDAATRRLPAETVPLDDALDRVLAADCRAGRPLPERDRAALDGFAVRALQSIGASPYNPLLLPASMVMAGDQLPPGKDAVVPLAAAEAETAGVVSLVEPVAPGENVQPEGAVAPTAAVLARSGTRLAARHIGLIAAAGIAGIAAVRRPQVSILLIEPPPSRACCDSNRPMLRALVRRDSGVVADDVTVARERSALVAALAASRGDIVLVIGGTGAGPDDNAAAALAEAGDLALHGMALRPGETTGLGRTRAHVPVVLLPGAPPSCLWGYEFYAGRAIRRLGGRDPALPFRCCRMTAARKIVSAIGMTEIIAMRFGEAADTIEPLPSFAEIGLSAAAGADGFAIIAEASEGYPPGAQVGVHLYDNYAA